MALTPEIQEEILSIFRQNPTRFSPFKTASAVGVPTSEVLALVDRHRARITSVTKERNQGRGRDELLPFVVARRMASSPWDHSDPLIKEARRNFEKGTHILCTGRDGSYLILYSIPRNGKPEPKLGYFNPEKN